MSTGETRDELLLESLVPRYVAEGFTVILHPSPAILPPFMGKYRPDAIALSPNKKLAIEIKSDVPTSGSHTDRLNELFMGQPDWELRIYSLPRFAQERDLAPAASAAIEDKIADIGKLRGAGHLAASMMMAWAALEAVGRALLPKMLARPQPAGRLVEVLASEGFIDPSEADRLRPVVDLRNAVAHGDFAAGLPAERVDDLIATVRRLAALLQRARGSKE